MRPNVDETQAGVFLDGRYRLIRRIGEGRAALVWLADDLLDRSHAAVKILHPHLRLRAEPRNRFAHEAEVLAELAHPSIVRVKSFNLETARPYIALEYREGASLDQELRARKAEGRNFEVAEVVAVIRELADALDAVHARGIVHRDLQPANIMVSRAKGRAGAYLFDFGIAQLVGEADAAETEVAAIAEAGAIAGGIANAPPVARVGRFAGSARYVAPEQARGESVDRRADVFSLGLLAYQLFTLERPWGEERTIAQLIAAAAEGPRPQSAISSRIDAAIARATAADRAARFESAGAFAAELARAARASWIAHALRPEMIFLAGGIATATAAAWMVFTAPWDSRASSAPDAPRSEEAYRSAPVISARSPEASALEEEGEETGEQIRDAAREQKRDGEFAQKRDEDTAAAETREHAATPSRKKARPLSKTPAVEPRPEPNAHLAAIREAIARAEAEPEDASRFRAAIAQLRARLRALDAASPSAPRIDRLQRLLEVAELSYDHAALAQIAAELAELDR